LAAKRHNGRKNHEGCVADFRGGPSFFWLLCLSTSLKPLAAKKRKKRKKERVIWPRPPAAPLAPNPIRLSLRILRLLVAKARRLETPNPKPLATKKRKKRKKERVIWPRPRAAPLAPKLIRLSLRILRLFAAKTRRLETPNLKPLATKKRKMRKKERAI
jgi:hypothetical protein